MSAPDFSAGVPGDLLIEVHLEPHPLFRREGLDLVVEVPVTIREALLGAGRIAVARRSLEGFLRLAPVHELRAEAARLVRGR